MEAIVRVCRIKCNSSKIAIAGSHGFIGSHLVAFFEKKTFTPLSIPRGEKDLSFLEEFDCIINLAGESLFGYWSSKKKKRLWQSRVHTTQRLVYGLLQLKNPPRLLINASAVGYYGDRGDALLDEKSVAGEGFLPNLVREWERAAEPARDAGIRLVWARFGVVLGPNGGILDKMKKATRWGLGAYFGSGQQWMSWIAIEDVLRAIDHIIKSDLEGAINLVSPNPVRQEVFMRSVAHLVVPIPESLVRLICGQGAEVCLSSQRVYPEKLIDSGFEFLYPHLQEALQNSI